MQFDAVSVFVCQLCHPYSAQASFPKLRARAALDIWEIGCHGRGERVGRAGVCNVRYDHSVMRMTLV